MTMRIIVLRFASEFSPAVGKCGADIKTSSTAEVLHRELAPGIPLTVRGSPARTWDVSLMDAPCAGVRSTLSSESAALPVRDKKVVREAGVPRFFQRSAKNRGKKISWLAESACRPMRPIETQRDRRLDGCKPQAAITERTQSSTSDHPAARGHQLRVVAL